MTYQASKQASKKTDFTVDLQWWGSLRLAPINTVNTISELCSGKAEHNYNKMLITEHLIQSIVVDLR